MIALVDCNNFYASCERIFRPDLVGKAIVVLSNNDGCVISRSQEAKELDIAMGAPYFKIEQQLKSLGVTTCSSNYTLYADISARVIECIDQFTDEVEVYSIDEAFAKMPNDCQRAKSTATHLRKTILQWTGIPVKVGVAPSKTLAKLAAKKAKTEVAGVYLLNDRQEIKELLEQTPLRKIWGIGRGFFRFLSQNHIDNAWQYSQLPDTFIRKHLGVVGLRMAYELRGKACLPLLKRAKTKQQVMTSRSFSQPITSLLHMKEAIASYVHENAIKLRREQLSTAHVSVYINTYEHRENERQHRGWNAKQLDYTTNNNIMLTKVANQLIEEIFRPNYKYKQAGVLFSQLTPSITQQMELFSRMDQKEERELNHVIDELNLKFGNRSIHLASTGLRRKWVMKSEFRSPRHTTHWEEIYRLQ